MHYQGGYELPKEIRCTISCLQFISGCLIYDYKKRFTWEQVITHQFITEDFSASMTGQPIVNGSSEIASQVEDENESLFDLNAKKDNGCGLNAKDPRKFEEYCARIINKQLEKQRSKNV